MNQHNKNNRFLDGVYLRKHAYIFLMVVLLTSFNAKSDPLSTSITISGRIIPRTCTFDETNMFINLGDLMRNEIIDNSTYAETAVNLSISSCANEIASLKITTSGTPDTQNSMLYKNTLNSANSASGIALRFMDKDGLEVSPSGDRSIPIDIVQGSGNYTFNAGYARNGETIVSGYFSAIVTVKLDYN